jgi:hypothetical protein
LIVTRTSGVEHTIDLGGIIDCFVVFEPLRTDNAAFQSRRGWERRRLCQVSMINAVDGYVRFGPNLRHPLIFYSDILGRCFGKWESREKGIFVHAKLPDSHDCIGEHLRN